MKRLLALLTAVLLVVGLFTGCGMTQETTSLPNDESNTAESSDPPADIEETVDVTGDWTFTFEGLFGEETFTLSLANDGTCEGIDYPALRTFTTQFHPEACAGPRDTSFLFDRFCDLMGGGRLA